jgi:hypothetical protein
MHNDIRFSEGYFSTFLPKIAFGGVEPQSPVLPRDRIYSSDRSQLNPSPSLQQKAIETSMLQRTVTRRTMALNCHAKPLARCNKCAICSAVRTVL